MNIYPNPLRSDHTMRTKCAIWDAFVRDCVFAYCPSVTQNVYSLPAEHFSDYAKTQSLTKGQATLCVQSAQYRTRSSEIAFLRTVLVWLSACIPYQLNTVSDYAITQYRMNAFEIAHLVRLVGSGLNASEIAHFVRIV